MVGIVLVSLRFDWIERFRRHGVLKDLWMHGRGQIA